MKKKNLKLFISYSHEDENYFEVFEKGFSKVIANAQNYIWEIWTDKKIYVGSFWDDEIQRNVKDCDVAILLVSVGFMSSKYIREKEYEEFIKRYRDKGILIIPLIFAPCDFDSWSDLAKLQFFMPKGSEFGQPELKDFTYADLIKFNERNGQIIPNPNIQRYHLKLLKVIEDSYLSFENSINLPELKIESESFIAENKLFDYPKPTALFTGRDFEKEQFNQMLKSFRIFAIDGLGGIGKTQFTAKCIEEFISDKEKIIWLDGSAQSSFDVFVENAGYGNILKGKDKTDLILFSGLKDLIEKDERIIFWDNFNDYEDKAFNRFLSFANYYLQKSRIILITRIIPEIDNVSSIPIISLEGLDDDAQEYAKKIKSSDTQYISISDYDIEKICIAFQGHPLAIEFSLSLLSRGKSVDDLILHLPELSGIKKVEEFSKRLFLDILNHPNTSEEERHCFLMCSVFEEKISEREIKYLNDGIEVFHLIDGLIDKLLLKSRNGYYEIHPLIRSFSYERLVNKKDIHKKAASYFISLRNVFFSPSLEEKIYYHLSSAEEWGLIADFLEKDGRAFLQNGQLNLLSDIFSKLNNVKVWRDIFYILNGDIAQIKSNWDDALENFKKATNSQNNKIKAEGMIKSGEIIFRKGNLKESLIFFENAFDFSNSMNLIKEKARALNDIGIVHIEFSNLEIANQKLEESLKLRIELNDKEDIAVTLNNIGNICLSQQKYSKALEYYYKSVDIAEEIGDKINLPLYYANVANVLRQQGKTKESLATNIQVLELYKEIGNLSGIATNYNSTAAALIAEKKYEDAFEKLSIALQTSIEINDRKNIGSAYHNLGALYFETTNYELSLKNLYKALKYYQEIGGSYDQSNTISVLKLIAIKIQKELFTEISLKVLSEDNLDINFREFLNEPYSRQTKKINRNDVVRAQYKETGKIVEAKFKKLEKDLANGDCFILED